MTSLASRQRAGRRWADVNKESPSLRPARKLLPLFPSLPADDSSPSFHPSFSRIAWPWCPARVCVHDPRRVRGAGRLIRLTLSTSATLRGRPWRCNGDAQLAMGVAARAKPPPCNVERRSIPNSRDSRFSTPCGRYVLCPPSTGVLLLRLY